MPRCLVIVFLLFDLGHSSLATAGDTIEILPEWPIRGSRPTIVRGPTRAPAALAAPPSAKPLAAPQIHVDQAVQVTTFRSEPDPVETITNLMAAQKAAEQESSPSDELPAEDAPEPTRIASLPTQTVKAGVDVSQKNASPGMDQPRRLLGRTVEPPIAPRPGRKASMLDATWSQLSGESVTTVGTSLAVVIGALLLLCWIWRRAAPRSAQPLPEDVMSVVGRFPLANRQVAQLVKLGSKLVLLSVTPEGVKPITEITDAEEVTRILGICEQNNPHSASAAFRDVFDQLIREPSSPGFLGDESPLIDRQKLADAYANTPGGRAYG